MSTTPAPQPVLLPKPEKPRSRRSELFELLRTIVVFVTILVFLRGSVVEAFKIPSSSMEPTLLVGDHILVSKLSFGFRFPFVAETVWRWSAPKRGDVVVFTQPDDPDTPDVDEGGTNIIKRVIGLPGEKVEVRGTNVFVNGELCREDDRYAHWFRGGIKDFSVERIPEGKILLLGDNRDFSRDSRFWKDPYLNIDRVKGRAFLIYFNTEFLWRRIFTIIR